LLGLENAETEQGLKYLSLRLRSKEPAFVAFAVWSGISATAAILAIVTTAKAKTSQSRVAASSARHVRTFFHFRQKPWAECGFAS
jgi:hypothetical protein